MRGLLGSLFLLQAARAFAVHGAGAEGTVMGPVAFLWPEDRPWDGAYDNVPPCGSRVYNGMNRTEFPLSQGSIELTIADEAWNVEFALAVGDDPLLQTDFLEQVVSDVEVLEPGHQCYKLAGLPGDVGAGKNATIQLRYTSNDSDKNETFYACADIQFVETASFKTQIPCFNVTASDFDFPSSSSSSSSAATSTASSASGSAESASGLSQGDKAGIAVGCIVGGLSLLGAGALAVLWRKRCRAQAAQARAEKEGEWKEGAVERESVVGK